MNATTRTPLLRIVTFVLSALFPLAVITLGVILLISNTLINTAFTSSFILLPICFLLLLFLLYFSKIKTIGKIVLTVFTLGLFVILFLFISFWGKFEQLNHFKNDEAIKHYEEKANIFETIPNLSEIGNLQSIDHYNYFSSQIFFTCKTDIFICKYSKSDYTKQKSLIEEKYVFQNEPMISPEYACDPTVEIDGFLFHTLSINGEYDYEISYPKSLTFIATNDKTYEIVYMKFYDDDLDYIVSLTDFINNDCGWKRIKK